MIHLPPVQPSGKWLYMHCEPVIRHYDNVGLTESNSVQKKEPSKALQFFPALAVCVTAAIIKKNTFWNL